MSVSLCWLGAQVGKSTPCDYVRLRADQTSAAFELHRFWLSFTLSSSFPSQVLCKARNLEEKKHTHKQNSSFAGLCLRTSADCKRSSGTGRRFCRRRVFSQLNKRCFFKDDRNKWNHYFHCIDAVFAAVSRIFQVACIASVSETGEFYCALGGHRTFLRCFARGVNRAS